MHPDTARRGRRLYVARAFLGLDVPPASMPSGLRALNAWLDTWHGIGLIEHGMARQARDISLTRYRDRWGATVFVTGMEHSVLERHAAGALAIAASWRLRPARAGSRRTRFPSRGGSTVLKLTVVMAFVGLALMWNVGQALAEFCLEM
jgi:hypothetical protein